MDGASTAKLGRLLSELVNLKWRKNVDATATKLNSLQTKINAVKKQERPSENFKKEMLIRCLPIEFRPSIIAIIASGKSDLTFNELVDILRGAEWLLESKGSAYTELANAGQHQG